MKYLCSILMMMMLSSSLYAQLVRDINKGQKPGSVKTNPTVKPRVDGAPDAADGPVVTKFSPAPFTASDTVTIIGKNLEKMNELSYDGEAVKFSKVISDSMVKVVVGQKAADNANFILKTIAGSFTFPNGRGTGNTTTGNTTTDGDDEETDKETIPEASADFTLPDVGQSNLNIIVTPKFLLNRIYYKNKIGVSGAVWGNSIGIDSLRDKVGVKFLLPQSSMLGMKFEIAYALPFIKSEDVSLSLAGEANMLFKKVGFLDTATRKTNDFSPFVFHFKPGVVASFFKSNILLSYYLNVLSVQTEVDKFKSFFNTGSKTTFTYSEVDISGVFDVGESSNQSVRVGFDFLINNSNTKYFTGSTDKIIPYLRVGVVSKL